MELLGGAKRPTDNLEKMEGCLARWPPQTYIVSMSGFDPCSVNAVSADLTVALGGLIRRVRFETRGGHINLSEASVMARLEREGALTTAMLARAEAMTPQSMGALIAQLERRGLVERQPHPTDGRQMLIALTDAGGAACRHQQAAKRAWLATAMERLDPSELHALRAAIPLIRRLGES